MDEELYGLDDDVIPEDETFEAIMERLLDRVPDEIDKREGSVIYNALAPAAVEIMILYMELGFVEIEAYPDTANLDYLIRHAAERGIIYKEASHAVVKGRFSPPDLDVTGGRFTELTTGLAFIAAEKIGGGLYYLECETAGIEGNISTGQLITDESFDDEIALESAEIIGLENAASDEEDVESLRKRYFDSIDSQAFGGNQADYRAKMLAQDSVGGVKVYPVWNGGGTVKLVFLNNAYSVPGESVVANIQEMIDPEPVSGEGLGIAPIGHVVTVEGAEPVPINIALTVLYTEGNTVETARASMSSAVEEYFLSVRKAWDENDCKAGSVVRISYIENKLLNLEEVLDVQVTSINDSDKNLTLLPHQVPVIGDFIYGTTGEKAAD